MLKIGVLLVPCVDELVHVVKRKPKSSVLCARPVSSFLLLIFEALIIH